jgi:endonuclease/exonuclease/phosphatase family metal-dependent hydrolase
MLNAFKRCAVALVLLTPALTAPLAGPAHAGSAALAPVSLRVMTWNIHGESADIPAIADFVHANGVNVLTVQEIHRRPSWDQVRQLADELGWQLTTNVHFGPADNPGPCDDEWEGQAGNAILTSFRIAERVTKPLSPASQDCPVRRSMAGVRLDLGDNRTIRVFTSHFSPGHSAAPVALRQQQARTVVDYLSQSGPLVFTGDINDVPGSTIHGWFVGAGFLDTGGRYANEPTLGTARIDFVFTRAVTVTSGDVLDTRLSDHRPVVMNMQVT